MRWGWAGLVLLACGRNLPISAELDAGSGPAPAPAPAPTATTTQTPSDAGGVDAPAPPSTFCATRQSLACIDFDDGSLVRPDWQVFKSAVGSSAEIVDRVLVAMIPGASVSAQRQAQVAIAPTVPIPSGAGFRLDTDLTIVTREAVVGAAQLLVFRSGPVGAMILAEQDGVGTCITLAGNPIGSAFDLANAKPHHIAIAVDHSPDGVWQVKCIVDDAVVGQSGTDVWSEPLGGAVGIYGTLPSGRFEARFDNAILTGY